MDERRAQLWQVMGLGPRWVERGAPSTGVAEAEAMVAAVAAVEVAEASFAPVAPPHASPRVPLAVVAAAMRSPAAYAPPPPPRALPAAAGLTVRVDAATEGRTAQIAALDWPTLEATVRDCTACALSRTRRQTVFGVGHRRARWMLVGEAPGADEDARGEPFVGQAGKLLDNMLVAVGLTRQGETPQSVFITNVLKCRPPGNRNPEPAEVALCEPFLLRQVALVQPELLLVMGRFAAQALLRTDATIASLRGRVHRVEVAGRPIPTIVTYHPAYLLRNLADKAKSWADLSLAHSLLKPAATA
jgi:DNA polymerase